MTLDWAALLAEALAEGTEQAPDSVCSRPDTGNKCTSPGTVLTAQAIDLQGIDETCSRVPVVPADFEGTQATGGWRAVTADAPAERYAAWRLHFPGCAAPLEVYVAPPMTRTEVLAMHGDALAADPIPWDCSDCRHRRRPGLSDGHCGGDRPDLPHAYGPGHPLRRLPEDGGKDCPAWAGR